MAPSELNKIYSVQYFATYVNKTHWNLFCKANEGKCGVCFFFSLLYEKDVLSDNMVISSMITKEVWLLYLMFSALVKQWMWCWTMLGWDRLMKGLTENPALSSDIPECAWEFCHFKRLFIKRNVCFWQQLYGFALMCNWLIEIQHFIIILNKLKIT